MSELSPEFRTDFAALIGRLFQTAFDDWNEMIGFGAAVEHSHVRVLPSSGPLVQRLIDGGIVVRTQVEGSATGPVVFVFPNPIVGAAAMRAMMLPIDEGGDTTFDVENAAQVEAAQELMNLFCGSMTRALDEIEDHKLRISQSVDHLKVEVIPVLPSDLPQVDGLAITSIDVAGEGVTGRAWCVMERDLAAAFEPCLAKK